MPWTLVKRGLKKQVITPLDAPQEFLSEATREREARSAAQDTAFMRALGLAHHWQRLLDEQRAASVGEIAEAEGMDVTQVRRVMRLTLLAQEVVERLVGSPMPSLHRAGAVPCRLRAAGQWPACVAGGRCARPGSLPGCPCRTRSVIAHCASSQKRPPERRRRRATRISPIDPCACRWC